MKTYSRRAWQRKLNRLSAICKANTLPSMYQLVILEALQERQMYAGTASPYKVRARRAKNRVAKQSRKANR